MRKYRGTKDVCTLKTQLLCYISKFRQKPRIGPTNFSNFSIQNGGSNLYGKNGKTASTEIDFIKKPTKILPNRDHPFKDEISNFPTSLLKMFQKV
jgi:hypothetical protein